MKKTYKCLLLILVCLGLLFLSVLPEAGAESGDAGLTPEPAAPVIETDVEQVDKYGNLVLKISGSGLLAQGYDYGDIISASMLGRDLEMPVVSDYSDVDVGDYLCILRIDKAKGQDEAQISINMLDIVTELGIAAKVDTNEDPGFRWQYQVPLPFEVTVSLKEKGGYAREYELHHLSRTNRREDYPDLTDEQYANFRPVTTTGVGKGTLYRSSSPVDPQLNRNKEADEALNNAGVRTVMNLADTGKAMRGYEDYATSYYSQRDVIPLGMSLNFYTDAFRTKLAEGLIFFSTHEGPYLVHCTEGKDRCGFVSALLECLMGASAEEVIADYMVTYRNYFGVEPGTEKYDVLARGNIEKTLSRVFGTEDIRQADLSQCAADYLHSLGLSDETVAALKKNLAAGQEDAPSGENP